MHRAIDYDRLLADYRTSLGARLRGFRASDDAPSFLETWVPGEDDSESVAALLDAASSSGCQEVRVRFGSSTLARTPRGELVRVAEKYGSVGTADGADFELFVRFRGSPGNDAGESTTRAKAYRRAPVAPDRAFTIERAAVDTYDAALAKVAFTHEGELAGATVCVEQDGASFAVVVDREAHVVTGARHRGAAGGLRAVLELLCSHAEGAPIWELADHAVIRVEHSLRGRGGPRAVPGIVTPDNADPRLGRAAELMRELGRAYSARTGAVPPARNEWEPSPSKAWQELADDARIARIQAKLDEIAAGKASCLRVDKDTKVIVALARDVTPGDKPALLMNVERALRDGVEPALGVWLEEVSDLNRIRIGRLGKDEGTR